MNVYSDNYYLRLAELSELKNAIRTKKINEELLQHLESTMTWLLDYCDKNDLQPPNLKAIKASVNYAKYLLNLIYTPPKFQHPDKTPKDSTESKIIEKPAPNQNFLQTTKAKNTILM